MHRKLLCIGKQLSTFPHTIRFGFEPLTSEVGGECINHYSAVIHLNLCDLYLQNECVNRYSTVTHLNLCDPYLQNVNVPKFYLFLQKKKKNKKKKINLKNKKKIISRENSCNIP